MRSRRGNRLTLRIGHMGEWTVRLLDDGGIMEFMAVQHRSCGHSAHRRQQAGPAVAKVEPPFREAGDEAEQAGHGVRLSVGIDQRLAQRSEEHTSALQALMRRSYADLCLKQNTDNYKHTKRTMTA